MTEIAGGVWPAMFTPMTDEKEPNPAMIDKLLDALIEEGADAVSYTHLTLPTILLV